MRRYTLAFALASFVVVLGCTLRTEHKIDATIRIEIRHIQEQASDALDYIAGETDKAPDIQIAPEPKKGAFLLEHTRMLLSPVSTAYAQEKTANTEKAKACLDRMRERYAAVRQLKDAGCLGETNQGYLKALDGDAAKKSEAERIAAEENADRKTYYGEIVAANKGVDSIDKVEKAYAQAFLKKSKAGDHVQLPTDGADFGAFKASEMGKRLGDEAKPGAWVVLK